MTSYFAPLEDLKPKPLRHTKQRIGTSHPNDETYAPIFATVYTAENKVTSTKSSLRIFDEAGVSKLKKGYVDLLLQQISTLSSSNESQKREIARLNSAATTVNRAIGERSEQEKRITLKLCLEHWEKTLHCRSEDERIATIRRVKRIVEQIGLSRLYCTITKSDIQKAIKASGIKDFERAKCTTSIKRFFSDLCKPKSEDGYDFTGNPAQNLKGESLITVQQRRRVEKDGIQELDPRDVLKLQHEKFTPYWRAVVALLGFGGLRLNEVAGLLWKHIDTQKTVIYIKPHEMHPELKTGNSSVRLVRPFPNIWKLIELYKEVAPSETIVFPQMNNVEKGWFHSNNGKIRCFMTKPFSKVMDKLKVVGDDRAYMFRHWWTTTMQDKHPTLETFMGGHSADVAREFYTKYERIVLSTDIKPIEEKA